MLHLLLQLRFQDPNLRMCIRQLLGQQFQELHRG